MNAQILIIDNDTKELRRLRKILSSEGYNIMTATDYETAVSICKKIDITYILAETRILKILNDKNDFTTNKE
jgi:PleD family two-component response regulator